MFALLQVDSEAIAIEKEGAEAALAEAIPILEEAAQALNDLKRDDITEIRSFAKPHVLVQKVWDALLTQSQNPPCIATLDPTSTPEGAEVTNAKMMLKAVRLQSQIALQRGGGTLLKLFKRVYQIGVNLKAALKQETSIGDITNGEHVGR